MLIKLTHPEPNYELWVDFDDIVVMERYNRPTSTILTMNDERPNVTAIVLKSGKTMAAKETPDQIFAAADEAENKFVNKFKDAYTNTVEQGEIIL
jgi:hypothetical protein